MGFGKPQAEEHSLAMAVFFSLVELPARAAVFLGTTEGCDGHF